MTARLPENSDVIASISTELEMAKTRLDEITNRCAAIEAADRELRAGLKAKQKEIEQLRDKLQAEDRERSKQTIALDRSEIEMKDMIVQLNVNWQHMTDHMKQLADKDQALAQGDDVPDARDADLAALRKRIAELNGAKMNVEGVERVAKRQKQSDNSSRTVLAGTERYPHTRS